MFKKRRKIVYFKQKKIFKTKKNNKTFKKSKGTEGGIKIWNIKK